MGKSLVHSHSPLARQWPTLARGLYVGNCERPRCRESQQLEGSLALQPSDAPSVHVAFLSGVSRCLCPMSLSPLPVTSESHAVPALEVTLTPNVPHHISMPDLQVGFWSFFFMVISRYRNWVHPPFQASLQPGCPWDRGEGIWF